MKQFALFLCMLLLSLWLGWPALPVSYPTPPEYFAFACEPLETDRVKDLTRAHHGNVLIGMDANAELTNTLLAARQGGARLHVYLEGPGGPTGPAWAPDELDRMQAAARSVGIVGKDWQARWDAGGWKVYTFQQLRKYRSLGFESAEIDNLYRVEPDLAAFYREYAGWWRQGLVPRALLKNVDQATMKSLEGLPREMFADFAIWESSASGTMGIMDGVQTLVSDDTQNYSAFGAYQLRK